MNNGRVPASRRYGAHRADGMTSDRPGRLLRTAAVIRAELDALDRAAVKGAGFTPYLDKKHKRLARELDKAERRERKMEAKAVESRRYLSVAETAKLIRGALKKAFPEHKFSVRSDSYAGGAVVDVSWTDGPSVNAVSTITDNFEGSGFDGMIDLKYSYTHWLLPDGSVSVAGTRGTAGSMGVYEAFENPKPHPDAERVHLGSDSVRLYRNYSKAGEALVLAAYELSYGALPDGSSEDNRLHRELMAEMDLPVAEVVKKTETPEEAAKRERTEAAKARLEADILKSVTTPGSSTGKPLAVAAMWFRGYGLNRSAVGGVFRSLAHRGLIEKAGSGGNGTTWWKATAKALGPELRIHDPGADEEAELAELFDRIDEEFLIDAELEVVSVGANGGRDSREFPF